MWLILIAQAHAQQVSVPEIDAELGRPSVDSRRMVWTDDAGEVSEDLSWSTRMVGWYANRPLVWVGPDGTERAMVGTAVRTDLIGAVGWRGFRAGLDLPVSWVGTSDYVANGGTGLGDLSLDARYTALDPATMPLGVAISGRLWLPTNTVRVPLGAPGVSAELAGVASREFGPVQLAANLGLRFAPEADLANVPVDDAVLFRLGGGWQADESWGLSGEIAGRVGWSAPLSSRAELPVELLASGWYRPTSQLVTRLGLGTGLTDGVGVPNARVVLGIGWEPGPVEKDVDEDGIVGAADGCPDRAEDLDGFEDEDGCPDIDDDADGVWDTVDKCPREPEDPDGYRDDDGCADPKTLVGVRIVGPDGSTLQGVTGTVDCGGQTRSVSADQAFEADPGPCKVEVAAEGFEAATVSFLLPSGPPFEQLVTLRPEVVLGRVDLTVVDPSGAPVRDRVAWAFDGGASMRVHDGTGQASVPPGPHEIRVFAQGYADQVATVEVDPKTPAELRITLQPLRVVVTRTRIEFDEHIQFATGEATIEAESFPLLDEIAQAIVDHPEILKVRIEGHTDDRGALAANQSLSERRAAAVRDALVSRGVAEGRLTAIGFGESKPLDPRSGKEAWDVNRRVELHVEERE